MALCLLLDQAEPLYPAGDQSQLSDVADIDPEELSQLGEICASVAADIQAQPGVRLDFRVFRRSVPVVSDLPLAAPAAAGGTAAARTFGPFLNPDHRPFWFTVYRWPRFVSVVRDGGTGRPMLFVAISSPPATASDFDLPAGTIWISTPLIAPDAPRDAYTGLRILGASVALDIPAVLIDGVLRVPAAAELRLKLKLDRPEHPADPAQNALHPGRIVAQHVREATLVMSSGGARFEAAADASLDVFDANMTLRFAPDVPARFDPALNRVLVPYRVNPRAVDVSAESALLSLSGTSHVASAAWALPVATPMGSGPGEAAGAGGLALRLEGGLRARWGNLPPVRLGEAQLLVEPGGTSLTASGSNSSGASHRFTMWPGSRPAGHHSMIQLDYRGGFLLAFRLDVAASEALWLSAQCTAHLDRPVSTDGAGQQLTLPDCLAVFFAGAGVSTSLLLEHTPVIDALAAGQASRRLPFALSNALVMTDARSRPVVCAYGTIGAAGASLERGSLSLQFGVVSILPILPDPYVDNLERPRVLHDSAPLAVLSSRIRWVAPAAAPSLSLKLIPNRGEPPSLEALLPGGAVPHPALPRPLRGGQPDPRGEDESRTRELREQFDLTLGSIRERLLLLDVSSNADQFGIGLASRPRGDPQQSLILIHGRSLVSLARDVRAFTTPQVQWEPVWTIQNPDLEKFPSPLASADDGGPTFLGIDTVNLVPLAPAAVVRELVSQYQGRDSGVRAAALFTLPFGMKAVAAPLEHPPEPGMAGATLALVEPRNAEKQLIGGLQLSLTALNPRSTSDSESPGFFGATVQIRNGVDPGAGERLGLSVLSDNASNQVEEIFNAEFQPQSPAHRVPVTRIDFSGYGASLFSKWRNPRAEFAETSQVEFDVMVGRTAYEVVQVRSLLYPWAVRVVRTVTIQRTSSGGVYRRDSGWVAESDGVFAFPEHAGSKIETHPGAVLGVFNVRRIRDTRHVYTREYPTPAGPLPVRLAAVRFDADVRISDVVVGGSAGYVTSVDQIGFVQLAPRKVPLTPEQYFDLLAAEGPLGGPVDCVIDVGRSGQRMRILRVDIAAAAPAEGPSEFAAAARGSVLLPRDGQWSVTRQPLENTLEGTGVDPHTGTPLVRQGRASVSETLNENSYLFAEPVDLFETGASRHNIGLLWSTGTQRVLFLQPRIEKGSHAITSRLRPLLADPLALGSSSAVFPPALACLEIPFSDYVLEVAGVNRLRLRLPSATFPAQVVGGNFQRELARGASTRCLADYSSTFVTLVLDSTAPESWRYEQTGVALVQELDGVHAKTSRGSFRASSDRAITWTLESEEFGQKFDEAKGVMTLFGSKSLGGGLPSGGAMAPLDTTQEADELRPRAGLKIDIPLPAGVPLFIGVTTGGHIEIAGWLPTFFSLEIVVGIALGPFPGGVLFKFEVVALTKKRFPASEAERTGDAKLEIVLAIGLYGGTGTKRRRPGEPEQPDPDEFKTGFKFEWEVFVGIGFTYEHAPVSSFGLGIIVMASGSAQYLIVGRKFAEVGLNFEGQATISFEGDKKYILCKGSIAVEITIAFVINIEWESPDQEVLKEEI